MKPFVMSHLGEPELSLDGAGHHQGEMEKPGTL